MATLWSSGRGLEVVMDCDRCRVRRKLRASIANEAIAKRFLPQPGLPINR